MYRRLTLLAGRLRSDASPLTARLRDDRGSFLVSAIVMILFLTAIGVALSAYISEQYQHTRREAYIENAQLTAEAGIERTVRKLNTDNTFAGYTSPTTLFDNTIQGRAVFTTTVNDDPTGKYKIIDSSATLYRHGRTTPYATHKVRVTVVGTTSNGYSVYTGPGGLILSGSARITNSDVYVNGYITLKGSGSIGTQDSPLNVNVANIQCPTSGGPTYPQLCTDGTQPISFGHSTYVYGTVCATGQTNTGPNNNIVPGNGGEGLKVGCKAPGVSPPDYDRSAHIAAVKVARSPSDSDIDCSKWRSGDEFSRTWPADLKLTGNVSLASSCDLTLTGNVYITGNLSIGGSTRIRVADSLGTTQPVVIVDGSINVAGSGSMLANSSGTGIKFISFKSSASCGPNCTSLTGNDLKNSQNLNVVDLSGSANLPGMVFQAYWGKLSLAGGGKVGAVAGQTIDMSGSGTVIFGTALSSGSKTWAITSYQRLY